MPLKINSKHKSVITYLRNYELIEGILDKLEECNTDKGNALKDRDKIYEIISKVYASDYDLENEDAADIIVYKYKKSILNIYKDVANQLFLVDNGKVFLKNDSLADYNIYATSLDIYPFFAQYLLQKSYDLAYKDSKNLVNYLIAYADETFRLYGNIESKIDTISDMHIHLGASLDFHYRINDILKYPNEQKYEFPQDIFLSLYKEVISENFYMIFSILETVIIKLYLGEIEKEQLKKFLKFVKKIYKSGYLSNDDITELETFRKQIIPLRIKPKEYKKFNIDNPVADVIFKKLLNYLDETSKEYEVKYGDKLLVMLFMYILNEIDSKKSIDKTEEILKHLIWLYLIFRNITKLALVQQHRREGFGYFASYATNKLYKKGMQINKPYRRLKSVFHNRLKTNIEGRTTVEFEENESKSALETKKAIIEYVKNLERIKKETGIEHNLKIIYHFIKIQDEDEKRLIKILNKKDNNSEIETEIENSIKNPRYSSLRERYKKEAMILNQMFVNPEYRFILEEELFKTYECKESKNKNSKRIDLFKEYIVGIDAANKEYLAPPEVFSAVYAFFKNSITSSGLVIENNINCEIDPLLLNEVNLQYTFHAGEEYRDIISGLRAIYEAIIFLNLKDEDRIGHAVALGIEPKLFLQNRENITLSKGEYLDNLFFLFYLLGQRDDSPISLEMLKNRIYRVASEIYNHNFEDKGYRVDDYVDAWLLRRNCPNEVNRIFNIVKNDNIDAIIGNQKKREHLKSRLNDVINGKYSKALFVKELIINVPNILELIEIGKYENIFIKNALPDFFNHIDSTLEPTKRYIKIKNNPNAFKIYDQYVFDPLVTYRAKQVYNDNPALEPEVYEFMQDLMMEEVIVKKNIIIEVLPTSNVLITSVSSYDDHPFIRLHPPKEIIPNRFGLRKSKIKLVLGTDDPGIQGTNLMIEIYHIKNIITKKYDKRVAEKYVIKMLEFANYLFNKK